MKYQQDFFTSNDLQYTVLSGLFTTNLANETTADWLLIIISRNALKLDQYKYGGGWVVATAREKLNNMNDRLKNSYVWYDTTRPTYTGSGSNIRFPPLI